MSQPPRGLAAGSTFAGAVGGLFAVVATLTGAVSGLGADGETDAADAGEGVTVGAAAKVVGRSLLTVEIVVMLAALATAGAGVSWRLSVGTGDNEAVLPGWTTTVFTAFGLIGSVEPAAGASIANGAAEATRTGAEFVRSLSVLSLPSFGACAVSHPSTMSGAVRLTAAILMLLSIRLRTRASRASAERPPNTTATRW